MNRADDEEEIEIYPAPFDPPDLSSGRDGVSPDGMAYLDTGAAELRSVSHYKGSP